MVRRPECGTSLHLQIRPEGCGPAQIDHLRLALRRPAHNDKHPDHMIKHPVNFGLLEAVERDVVAFTRLSQAGRGIACLQVRSLGQYDIGNIVKLQAVAPYELIKDLDIDLEVVYDLEDIDYDESRLEGVSSDTRTDCAMAFSSKIQELGYDPMIYTNLYWAEIHYDLEKVMNYPIWFAQYSDTPDFPYYFTLWQYTNSALFDGVDVQTDINLRLVKK